MKILLVENDAGDARRVERLLRDDRSPRVVVVGTLADAMAVLSHSDFDAALVNLRLPDSQGIDTLVAIQRAMPAMPVIVLTGAEDQETSDEAIRVGAQDYLAKGALSVELLSRTIRYAVERKRIQRELADERGRLFSVLDSLPMFIYLQAPDYTIPFANRTFRELFGDIEGRPCYEVFHSRSEPCEACPTMRVQDTGEPEISEWTSAAGRAYAIYDQVFPGPNDTPLTLEVGLDITEERRAQRELVDSEARFRRVAENAPDVIWRYRVAPERGFDYVSPAVSELTGYTPEQHYADPDIERGIVHPDDQHLQDLITQLSPGEATGRRVRWMRWIHRDGRVRWIEDHYTPVYDERGRLVAVEGIARDITEQRAAQEALAESERRFREQSELLPEVVYECDVSGRITFANRVAFERFGYSERDLARGVKALDMLAPEDRDRASGNIGRILGGESIGGVEYTALAKDGSTFPVIVHSVAVLRDGEVVGLRGIIVDISEQLRAREALKTADEIVSALPTGMLIYRYREPDEIALVSGNAAAAPFVDVEKHNGKGLESHWPASMVERLRAPLLTVAREGGVYDSETTVGPEHAFHMRAFRIPGQRIVVAFEDIAERKRAVEALRAGEEKYRLLFENMMNGFALHEIVLDERGRAVDYVFLEVNSAFERLTGLSREELIGRRVTEVLPGVADDPADWIGRYGAVTLTGEQAHFEQYSGAIGKWFSVLAFRPREGQFATVFEDVTERKRAEAAVVEWKNRYEGAIEASRHILYDWDSETSVVTYGGDLERILGYTHAEMAGGLPRWKALIHPDDRGGFERAIEQLVESREAAHLRYRVRRKDGTYIHVEDDGSFISDAEGRPIRMLGFVKDVTEQRLAAERVEESEWRYRSIVELAPTGIVTVDLKGFVTSCNRAFAEMTGYAAEALVGGHFSKLPPAKLEDIPKYLRMFRLILTGRTPGPFETSWTRKDGTIRVGEIRVSLMERDRRPWGIQVIIQDITERKEAEREAVALRARLELTQYSIDSTEAVVLWARPDGQFIFVNDAACRMLGYEREELLGMAVWDIDPEYPEQARDSEWEQLKRIETEISERTFRRKSGDLFPVEITAQYLVFQGQELEFVVAFDTSERKRLEAQLRQSQRLESIGTLASGVAHEINNPLTGIINYAQLISDRTEQPKLKEFADGIREEGNRVASIVQNLLSFSRRDREHHSPARIIDIVNASLSLCTALLRRDQIEVELDVSEDLPLVNCRSQEIQQVLINLLTNARDSLNLRHPVSHKDKRIVVRARVLARDATQWIRLSVIDRGTGIPSEIIDRIFDPFFTTKPRDRGTGLGLSVSYGLVRDHGGQMSVESVEGERTSFFVDLPVEAE